MRGRVVRLIQRGQPFFLAVGRVHEAIVALQTLMSFQMPNQIQVIAPYWIHGTWVFDDPSTGLVQEPFVSGVPEMIDDLVSEIPSARSGFRLLFSTAPFPGFQQRLKWVREEMEGNWYRTEIPPQEGWLCPALFKYFEKAPQELFVKAEELKKLK